MRSASDVSRTLPILLVVLLCASPVAGQETPPQDQEQQPTVEDTSAEGAVPEPLPPPLARPPEGLELVEGAPQRRAAEHMARGEVLDALAIRVLRRVDEASPCELIEASAWEAALALDRAWDEQITAGALLASSVDEVAGSQALLARLEGLRSRLADLTLRIEAVTEQARLASCDGGAEAPVYLAPEYAGSVDGSAAILLRAEAPGRVVWIDGSPAVVAGPGGWAVAVVPVGLRRVCAAEPADVQCPVEREIDAGMGVGFDLRQ
jgi:hypothetical protein